MSDPINSNQTGLNQTGSSRKNSNPVTPNPAKFKLALIAAALVLGIIVFFWAKGAYNSMVDLQEEVKTAWSQVENQYQRRADLIPNLVNTVKGYAAHERQTLEGVINARARATGMSIDPSRLNEQSMQVFQDAQGQLDSALSRLLAVAENYPELKASESFRELQVQLEGTENRISVERKRYNESAQKYNTHVRRFPSSLFASIFGFEPAAYFKANPGSSKAPTVNFAN